MNMIQRIAVRQQFSEMIKRKRINSKKYPEWHKRVMEIYERVAERQLSLK